MTHQQPSTASDQKTCVKCGETKAREEFHKDRKMKDGLRSDCKECNRERARKWQEANPERHHKNYRKWYAANTEHVRGKVRKWREANPERHRENSRKWREANPEHGRKWREANPDKVYEYAQERLAKQSSRVRRIRRLLDHFEGRGAYLDYIAHAIDRRSDARGLQWLCSRIDALVAERVYGEV